MFFDVSYLAGDSKIRISKGVVCMIITGRIPDGTQVRLKYKGCEGRIIDATATVRRDLPDRLLIYGVNRAIPFKIDKFKIREVEIL